MIDITPVDIYYYDIYKKAVDAQSRYVRFQVEINVLPPEIEYTGYSAPGGHSPLSRIQQITDRDSKLSTHGITMELNRWIIGDMSFLAYDIIPEETEVGYESNDFSATSAGQSKQISISCKKAGYVAGVGIDFPNDAMDGYATNIYVSLSNPYGVSGQIRDNRKRSVFIPTTGYSNPSLITITIQNWSLPNRRARIPEVWVGYHDVWGEDKFSSMSISQKGALVPFSIPYTTCTLQLDNSDKLFDPTNKYGLFRSITDRQPVSISMNVIDVKELYDPDGLLERFLQFFTIGTFYQYDNGWKTGNSDLSMTWNLVDLMGLLADRVFDASKLREVQRYPIVEKVVDLTTVEEWVKEVLSQLGKQFASLYEIPQEYASIALPKVRKSMMVGVTCGDLLLWICQAINCWMRLTPEGKIYIGRFDRLGQDTANHDFDLHFGNLSKYPSLKANDTIARIDFTIPSSSSYLPPLDDEGRIYSVYSEDQSSSNTQSITNPFLRTEENARAFANYAFQWYGGNQIETSGRGNPIRELGDLVHIEISKGAFLLGRVIEQTFELSDHVMKDCKTTVICVDSIGDYNAFVILTQKDVREDGYAYWTVPDNLEIDEDGYGRLKIVLVQAGQSGGHGLPTVWNKDIDPPQWEPGVKGQSGDGGQIYIIPDFDQATRGEEYYFTIGKAADPRSTSIYRHDLGGRYMDMDGQARNGGHTIAYRGNGYDTEIGTSEDGSTYGDDGYIEPVSGKHLGRSKRGAPSPDSGDGGSGGGSAYAYLEETELTPEDLGSKEKPMNALAGSVGIKGADGCVIICYKAGLNNSPV